VKLLHRQLTDTIVEYFGLKTPCTTAEQPLEGQEKLSGYPISKRLVEMDDLICECELVTRSDIERVIDKVGTKFLGDIQHRTRLGMGPCQGGFCTHRALGLVPESGKGNSDESLRVLKEFLQNRFKGIQPVLWGDQLREEQLIEGIYMGILGMSE